MDTELVALSANFKRHSLQALSCLLLGHSISKTQQCSNWAATELQPAQVRYAATDAWVSREISLILAPLWFPRGGGLIDKQWLAPPRIRRPRASPEPDAAPAAKRLHNRQSPSQPHARSAAALAHEAGSPQQKQPHAVGVGRRA